MDKVNISLLFKNRNTTSILEKNDSNITSESLSFDLILIDFLK